MGKGKVSIVGAGPGDPELLTIKALRRLQTADVVLHDSLVSPEILSLCPDHAEKYYVGKRFGDAQDQTVRQEQINHMMVEYARHGKHCVRLKAGDPLIFGRGIEEIKALLENEIEFEVIPGISAGIAAANLFHIPITERNKNSSVLFCTGHTVSYTLEHLLAIGALIREGTPLVMYMGLKNLEAIIGQLRELNISPETQVCALSRVSYPDQAIVDGTLETILEKLKKTELKTPVVFLIGEYAHPIEKTLLQSILTEQKHD